jgi:hypothetical protein
VADGEPHVLTHRRRCRSPCPEALRAARAGPGSATRPPPGRKACSRARGRGATAPGPRPPASGADRAGRPASGAPAFGGLERRPRRRLGHPPASPASPSWDARHDGTAAAGAVPAPVQAPVDARRGAGAGGGGLRGRRWGRLHVADILTQSRPADRDTDRNSVGGTSWVRRRGRDLIEL